MTTKEVRETLQNEMELLEPMAQFVRRFDSGHFTGQAKFIRDSWANFLEQRYMTNKKVIDAEDLKAELESEREQIQSYVEATDPDPEYAEEWRKFFLCEQDILEHLIARCDEAKST